MNGARRRRRDGIRLSMRRARRGRGTLSTGCMIIGVLFGATSAPGQTFTTADPRLAEIWVEGMERSQAYSLGQALFDSIGPRLTGTPGHEAGNEWLVRTYRQWGIEARVDPYGEWMRWRRGRLHVDLVQPRVRSLEATLMAWSPGTSGESARGEVTLLPPLMDAGAFAAWLPTVNGKFVAISFPEPTCRPDDNWEEFATPESLSRMRVERQDARRAWQARLAATGRPGRALAEALEDAGAIGILTSRWSNGWGVQKVFAATTQRVPQLDVSCEDYGLLARLAEHGQGPVVEVMAEAEFMGVGPVANVIGTIPGRELPDEYVMLSAHFDSWHAGSGTTDNGTGTLVMLEAMRILRTVYPNPRRTILVGHWGGEEQGLNGSRAFAASRPEVVSGLQALFNQDNGTGRIVRISGQGLTAASGVFARWLSLVPSEITRHITFSFPGMASGGGSDHAAFICHGAPAFSLGAISWSYGTHTWHTNRDTFDKIVFDDLHHNATLTAMLAYLASEEEERMPRDRRSVFPTNPRSGRTAAWPECRAPRTWDEYRQR